MTSGSLYLQCWLEVVWPDMEVNELDRNSRSGCIEIGPPSPRFKVRYVGQTSHIFSRFEGVFAALNVKVLLGGI